MISKEATLEYCSQFQDYAPEPEPEPEPEPVVEPGAIILNSDDLDVVAKAFQADSKVKYKYNRFDGFSIFVNGKYQKVEDVKEIRLHARRFLDRCRVLKQKKIILFPRKTIGYLKDMTETLASLKDVHLLPNQKAPFSLDGKLDHKTIIAANNCLIDIKEYPFKTYPITEQFYTFNYLTYDYDAGACCELWERFVVDFTVGDEELILLLQQWCGYLLLPTLKHQKFLLCVGEGSNGKGVFFDTIAAALGKKNVSNVPLAKFVDKHTVFGTYGKMANMSNENEQELEAAGEAIIKEYVGGDKMLWEQKYRDAFFDYPTAKLMFACNDLPRIRDGSDGMWRRMILFPCKAKFEGDAVDKDLPRKLQEPKELSGILNWMLEGALQLSVNGGFVEATAAEQALEAYRNESNSARSFLLEDLEPGGDVKVPCTPLHKWYQAWCKDNGFEGVFNNVHFGRILHKLFAKVKISRPWIGRNKVSFYVGVQPQEGSDVEAQMAQWS